jgi:hypothetical protein
VVRDVAQHDECVAFACLIALLLVSFEWVEGMYSLDECEDEVGGIWDEMFRVVVNRVDGEYGVFSNVRMTMFLRVKRERRENVRDRRDREGEEARGALVPVICKGNGVSFHRHTRWDVEGRCGLHCYCQPDRDGGDTTRESSPASTFHQGSSWDISPSKSATAF